MDYESAKELVKQELSIGQPKYQAFQAKYRAVSDKLNAYRSQIDKNIVSFRREISETKEQIRQKNQALLAAQIADDAATVALIGVEVTELNAKISGLQQKIENSAVIDANDLILDELNGLRDTYRECGPERDVLTGALENHRQEILEQLRQLQLKEKACRELHEIISRTPEREMLKTLVSDMYSEGNPTYHYILLCMYGHGATTDTWDWDTPVKQRIQEIYNEYGRKPDTKFKDPLYGG